jgi:hypothetical protein
MEDRAAFLIRYAQAHGPVTIRCCYYQAEVGGIPGIGKDESGYRKVQRQMLGFRRAGRLSYTHIADATRWMRKPASYGSLADALEHTARTYRRDLWQDAEARVEIWLEKDALAGVIYPITSLYDVPLMVTRGFSSETFCYEAVEAFSSDPRPYYVYNLADFDRSGLDASRSLEEKLRRFARERGITVYFERLGVTLEQIVHQRLPTRPHKRESVADRKWPHPFACELDAMAPHDLRGLVEKAITNHLPQERLRRLMLQEEAERESFLSAFDYKRSEGGRS